MAWFKLYAGLGGGFGGAHYIGTYEYSSKMQAEADAYQLAIEEYESYAGSHGIMSWSDVAEDLADSFDYEASDDDIDDAYREEVESWITYYAVPASGPDDVDD